MPEDTPGEEQLTMLSFTEAADRLVTDGIAESMTAEGLRRLARDPLSGWPIGPDDYRVVGKTRMLPYELLAPYMRSRKRGRGPAKQPPKRRTFSPKQQGENVSTTVDPRTAILSRLNDPPYNEVAERRCVPWDEAEKLLGAYRRAVLREAADKLDESETLRDLTDDHMHDINAAANELRRMADEVEASAG